MGRELVVQAAPLQGIRRAGWQAGRQNDALDPCLPARLPLKVGGSHAVMQAGRHRFC